jgi:hypothetical protein
MLGKSPITELHPTPHLGVLILEDFDRICIFLPSSDLKVFVGLVDHACNPSHSVG